jgi:hypothetical protein
MDGDDGFGIPGPLGYPSHALTARETHAQWAELDEWVGRLHAAFEDFWPPLPKGIMEHQRQRDLPWPACWRQHPGLVQDLIALKAWHDALGLSAGSESAAKSWMEWTSTVQHLLVPRVQRLARYCQRGHREPAIANESRLADLVGMHLKGVRGASARPASPANPPPVPQHRSVPRRHHHHGDGLA